MRINLLLCLFCAAHCCVQAQNLITIADSLRLPLGIEARSDGKLWVAESGFGANDGAIQLLAPDGATWPVIVGLPSIFDTSKQEVLGPTHTHTLPNDRLAVTVLGQVLIFDVSAFSPGLSLPLSMADVKTTYNVLGFSLSQGFAESNPYALTHDTGGNLYVADAAANAIIKVEPTGQMSVFATFPPIPNPLPFGPPVIDAVPTRIINRPAGGFYVSQLTGFPFLDGAARVFALDTQGNVSEYASGLTQLTDLALDANTGDLFALQFARFDLMGTPPGFVPNTAMVTRLHPNGTREIVADGFDLSAGLTLDSQGNLYVTELGNGRVLRLNDAATGFVEKSTPLGSFTLAPNPTTGLTRIDFTLKSAASVQLRVYDPQGRLACRQDLGWQEAGPKQAEWQSSGYAPGVYSVEIQSDKTLYTQQLVVF